MDWDRGGERLREYGRVLARRRWAVYVAVTAALLVAVAASFLATPLYRATCTVQIERQNPDVLTFRDLSQIDYSWMAYGDFYQTQYRIIASKPVALRAAEDLRLADHPRLGPDGAAGPGPLTRLLGALRSAISRAEPAEPPTPEEIAAARVLAGLEVDRLRNSHLVGIAWVGEDPALTAEIANAVAEAYIRSSVVSERETTEQARQFLDGRLADLSAEIREKELALQDYGESKRIVSIEDSNNITLQALKDLSTRLTAARTELAGAAARWEAVRAARPDGLPEVLQSDLIARLRQENATQEAEYSAKVRRFKEDWPGLQTLSGKIEETRRRLEEETDRIADQVRATAESRYLSAKNEVDNLQRLLDDQENDAQRQRENALQYATLQTEIGKLRDTYNAMLQRRNEMRMATELRGAEEGPTNVRIVERAEVPAAPFQPNLPVNLAIGLLLGGGIGVGLAFVLDSLDNTLSNTTEVERLVGLPVLAAIPRHRPEGRERGRGRAARPGVRPAPEALDLIAAKDTQALVSEAYRELRTAFLLSHAGEPPRQVMVTSAEPEDGKSSTAINLATVLAQLGRRVLLVDTDLRKPRLHRTFDLDNARGVSTYLSGMEDDATQLVSRTSVDGLDLVSSGPIPPNPSELLNSPRFTQFGRALLRAGYQHLIFDSAPLLSVSDAMVLASRVESTILVVRADKTTRPSLRLAVEKLCQAGREPAGVVLNDVDEGKNGGQRYRYYGAGPEAGDGDTEPEGFGARLRRKVGAGRG